MGCLCLALCFSQHGGKKGQAEPFPAVDRGQELPQLKLERPEKGKEGEDQGYVGSTRLPVQEERACLSA